MSKNEAKQEAKEESATGLRPVGLSFSFVAYALAGIYFLAYPTLRDTGLYPLYVIGALSLIGSFGIFRMTRWGVWLGLLVYPLQLTASSFALMTALGIPGLTSDLGILGFIASLIVLIFLCTLSFLFILDKRRSFKQPPP